MAIENKQRVLYLASRNPHKIEELQAVLNDSAFEVRPCTDLDPTISWVETGSTFLENALIKAQKIKNLTPHCVLADDSGLEVYALNGAPGVYSSSYGGKDGDHNLNNQKLLNDLILIPSNQRQARFVCCLIFIDEANTRYDFFGYCDGSITDTASGAQGFGYDPYFYVSQCGKTMAELTLAEKNAISHRGRALKQFAAHVGGLKR